MKATLFNIQRFCTDDGDGIRIVFFLKGCPLRCKWCHNPESQLLQKQMYYNPIKCIGCGACVNICEHSCHVIKELHLFNRNDCRICGRCADACPTGALDITGKDYSIEELIKVSIEDIDFYGDKGGVTLSGGEPLLFSEFAIEFLKRLKEEKINTAVETCGYFNGDLCDKISDYVDTFLFDYKVSFDKYADFTGVNGNIIENNLSILSQKNRIILRCPIIGGCNDNDEHINSIICVAKKYNITEVHLLPYHNLGVAKATYWELNQEKFTTPEQEKIKKWESLINSKLNITH